MLAKYNAPTYPFLSLEREMNRLFNDAFPALAQNTQAEPTYSPVMNLWEDTKNYFVSTELPGMKQEEIEVSMNASDLVISGERKEEKEESDEKKTWHRRETRYGKFYRMVSLPQDIDADKISAELKNGVLTVTVPKAERSQPNKITIKSK